MSDQHVCLQCGYNMVGYHPDACPFCGAAKDKFITAEECSSRFRILATPVTDRVTRLNSTPSLGLEHAAYRVETGGTTLWVDCPSSFDGSVDPPEIIIFTHHHFLGASNLYRQHFGADVRINEKDSTEPLCRGFTFDRTFQGSFSEAGLEAFHIDGHTTGFTFYILEDVLFICDYIFFRKGVVKLNPFGPREATVAGAEKLLSILDTKDISIVCAYNYVTDYPIWIEAVRQFLPGI